MDLCNTPLGSGANPACVSDDIVNVYCNKNRLSAGDNMRCDGWVMAECGLNPFDRLCGDGYATDRTARCLGGNGDGRCPGLDYDLLQRQPV